MNGMERRRSRIPGSGAGLPWARRGIVHGVAGDALQHLNEVIRGQGDGGGDDGEWGGGVRRRASDPSGGQHQSTLDGWQTTKTMVRFLITAPHVQAVAQLVPHCGANSFMLGDLFRDLWVPPPGQALEEVEVDVTVGGDGVGEVHEHHVGRGVREPRQPVVRSHRPAAGDLGPPNSKTMCARSRGRKGQKSNILMIPLRAIWMQRDRRL